MKIAFLTHEPFYPPSGGGSAEAIYLVQEFVRRGHEVHVFCPAVAEARRVQEQFKIELHEFTAWQMGRYTSFRNFKYLLYPSFLARMVERSARELRFDLIFSQHAIAAVAAGRLKRTLRVPVAMNFLDYLTAFMETWPAYLAPPPWLAILKRFELSLPQKSGADGVLTVSDTLADFVAATGYPRERIRPIYFGYDARLFPFQEQHTSPHLWSKPVIAMHGSLDHHHLGAIALEAMARVAQQCPQAVFRFIGQRTGALESFLGRLNRRVPNARVECTGFVPYSEVAQRLADAVVGIVPYEESTGTHCAFVAKIVEYLGIGLPVVSTPLDSARRYFQSEPMIRFSEFNGASFGERILSWQREPPLNFSELARAAHERVRRELDWEPISRRAADFIEQIARTLPS